MNHHEAAPTAPAEAVEGWPDTPRLSRTGRYYFAGQPGEAGFRRAAAEGVALVINLRVDAEMAKVPFDEPALVADLGLEYVAIPVTPATFSAATVDRFAEAIATTDQPVLVHCASSNRVGGLWAAYLARVRTLDSDAALELGKTAGLRSPGMIEATRRVTEGGGSG
jgi:uncharacterized protein (TIGR01244 family)